MTKLSDLRSAWRAHVGDWHGPRVERWTIPEENVVAFFDAAIARIAADMEAQVSETFETAINRTPDSEGGE